MDITYNFCIYSMLVYGVDREVVEIIKQFFCIVCLLVQFVLISLIASIVLKNMDLGLLILYFIGCEFILSILKEPSLIKIVLAALKKD